MSSKNRGLAVGLGSLSEAQFTRRNARRLISPRLAVSRPGSRAIRGHSRRFRGAPQPLPRPPAAPRFRLLGARRRGERERPSPLTLQALGGGTAPQPSPPPTPNPGAWLPYSSSVLRTPGHRAYSSPVVAARHAWTPRLASDLLASTLGSLLTPHDTALLTSSRDRGNERQRPGPSLLPPSGSLLRDCKIASPGSGAHLIQTVHLLRGVHDLAAPGAVGVHGSGKGWGGDARARARSFPGASWRETAAPAATQAAATAAEARELASASALLPLINTVGRRGCTGAGTRRRRGQGRARRGALPGRRVAARGRVPGRAARPGCAPRGCPEARCAPALSSRR